MNKWVTLPKKGETTTSSAQSFTTTTSSSTRLNGDKLLDAFRKVDDQASKEIEKAVYSHLRAIRTLGRTSVTAKEIAEALGITVSDAERALLALGSKGVKLGA